MFNLIFPPTCPCDPAAKAWIEKRLQWLSDEFPESAFSGRPMILPTPEFFPDPYDGSNKSVRLMLDRVCEYMDIDPYTVSLEFTSDTTNVYLVNQAGDYLPGTAAGTYQSVPDFNDRDRDLYEAGSSSSKRRSMVRINRSQLHHPMGLVGTIAHELAHARLLGERRVQPQVYDNELLTDLTTVHFGLGIFLANTPRNWDGQYTRWPNSKLKKPEYMTPPMYGWSLALLAQARGEAKPVWSKYLRGGAREPYARPPVS